MGGRATAPKIGLLRREGAPQCTPACDGRRERSGGSRTGRRPGGQRTCAAGAQRGAGARPRRGERTGAEAWLCREAAGTGGLLSASASTCPSLDRGLRFTGVRSVGGPEPPEGRPHCALWAQGSGLASLGHQHTAAAHTLALLPGLAVVSSLCPGLLEPFTL